MKKAEKNIYPWIIIGGGPAGLASAGLLLESGVNSRDILLIDPKFQVGDFGKYWGEVYSNTTVELFLNFLNEIQGFSFNEHSETFPLESKPKNGFCQLKEMTKPLQWVSDSLCNKVDSEIGYVNKCSIHNGTWKIDLDNKTYYGNKVILTTGATPRSLSYAGFDEISLYDALNPPKLKQIVQQDDTIAVFGSSHSSMIIIKNLLDLGVRNVINFYLIPHRYAIKMDNWILYDNTGLKGDTAEWVRKNISEQLDSRIKRYISNEENIAQYMPACNKAIYPVGFTNRAPQIVDINTHQYDPITGIIAPGLFGAGIGFPFKKVSPLGGEEYNVGLYKFMDDIRRVVPIWKKYHL